ncbi:hypothetical protein CBF34_06425 [Vagococcus penaei]|uniref:Uncharacterized protein n=1 Tax=Vagococcus penaei TaxID=633807 RepID=A0A1Q2D6Z5_9ENTE|nr:histidine phosphatase family protein [Vagococcus penaei]AQP54168.1 hypothetical protein BW732_08005 [Vagococcus penaei]RSU02167.1 hypothetical protein CBF34_06425 [Vagococcus penaei]
MKLYFTRHGKTEWNQTKQLQGRMGDSPLLPQSFEDSRKLGRYLADVPFTAIYSSPALRTEATTLEICRELTEQPKVVYVEPLREMGFGELEGEAIAIANATYPIEMKAMMHAPADYDPTAFNGESFPELIARSTEFVKSIVRQSDETDHILFVGHGMALTACIQTLIGTPLVDSRKQGTLDNNSLTILEYQQQKFTLERWNDVSFLN